ncbi:MULTISPECIES: hypothetical protein [Prochlorococcus]|uniref:Uncharacterized protein n=1 Tax=Prochlorococcus marinus (strain SARG / CCMP1375 / SS120) TaxID=167539 RepID=Q7VB82_PROMA|nr:MULTISPECIES: hypothetical protein [Prochlorococcus]AAQ00261.1 Predicted protein [Prochlorococcus marinus subsp. marinus str. CCMP1375]KGG14066.1 hypothetical protein EV04_0551 [Prochlorococcus marinus str. LG]KGG19199.1 hypothetical protein EV08_1686 [Prochlorococcus marinus str. SS2]KGG25166.1 hypothetical protein EV09_0060 [Prochlorococcus marinus str. SS35]KGG33282.1 hypothetical protein EV10_0489 [Prochlorococcus marinus str. SS51]
MGDETKNGKESNSISQLLSVTSERETAKRAINQLLSIIIGHQQFLETEALKDDPKLRIKRSIEFAMAEYAEGNSLLHDCVPDARRIISESQRKLDSLNSLSLIANFLETL